MSTEKDIAQDELIRRNAEAIRRNEAAIQKQTACLEKIRDHYFPKKTLWKRICGFCLKVVGVITIYTGMMEATEWYLNSREIGGMAEQSASVARRLFFEENDAAGALAFMQKAVDLAGNNAKYRTMLAFMKGMATVADLFDLGRPLTADERTRVDEILSEAVFLQAAAPDNPMPYILSAQAYVLREEFDLAKEAVRKAVEQDSKNPQIRCSACAMRFLAHDIAGARVDLAEAVRLNPGFPLVRYWQGMLAAVGDKDFAKSREHFEAMSKISPRLAMPHAMIGWTWMNGERPDYAAARAEFEKALKINPRMKRVVLMMGESYEREGNLILARFWIDRVLREDCCNMKGLLAKTRICEKLGEFPTAAASLATAMGLDPLRADLYREHARILERMGKADDAANERKTADALDAAAGKRR